MIRPLDLQTLFMNLDKVGKDQAASKEAQAQAQANQVTKLQKEHDQSAHAVRKTNPTGGAEGETSVKVQADGHNPQGQEKPKPRAGSSDTEDGGKKEKQDSAWKDPELGKHVDLSG